MTLSTARHYRTGDRVGVRWKPPGRDFVNPVICSYSIEYIGQNGDLGLCWIGAGKVSIRDPDWRRPRKDDDKPFIEVWLRADDSRIEMHHQNKR